jgi:two-component system phosphate regulon sensor histidine kinase PhoR
LDEQRLTEITRNPAIYSAFLDALKGHERSEVRVETHGPERVFDLRVVPLGGDNDKNGGGEDGALGVFIDVTRIERLERVRQEFLSNISHDLRTPLTAIMAFVETLETGALDDKENSLRFLSIIRRNAARMHDLIDDLLELNAIEAGNVQVRPELIELRPIVNDVLSLLETNAAARNIVLTNEIAREATVFADARRLEQMLTNLVDNAIKFNRENGAVTIRFEGAPATGTGDETSASARILVEDTGEGIPAHHLARLFERFYRVDRARSQDMGGTGLGLAIVKHLARAHDGEITVTSEVGTGTTFAIELPVRTA